ncbi:MAG: acyl carrier protein [Saprospiraceae bacterium]|nr:acyl carrier protein [Saprospiraceae bacterium]
MKSSEFLSKLAESMEFEDVELSMDTNLNQIEDYDSFALMSIVAFVHSAFGVRISAESLAEVKTPADIIVSCGIKLDDID